MKRTGGSERESTCGIEGPRIGNVDKEFKSSSDTLSSAGIDKEGNRRTAGGRGRIRWSIAALALGASLPVNAECMLGELMTFAGNFVPRGYAAANGQLLSISQNTALFSIIGTRFGGDGRTTFALPNVQNGLTHQPAGNASSSTPVPLQTLICVSGTFPQRS